MKDRPSPPAAPQFPSEGEVLVTGGGGFLGGGIVRALLQRRFRVRSFSRSLYPELEILGVEQSQGDLADLGAVERACENCDLVFHVAARAGIWGTKRQFYDSNVVGTRNVIEACRRNGIQRLVFTSSPSVVFDGRDMEGADESVPYPGRFHAFYPETKALAEQQILAANGPAVATVALRPHLIWGPGDTHVIPGILRRARSGSLRQIGRKQKLVDFTFIDNAVDAHLRAAERLAPGSPIAGKSYFITDGKPVALWDFINRLLAEAELNPVTKVVPPGVARAAGWIIEHVYGILGCPNEPRLTYFLALELSTAHWFDISAARSELGYEPLVGLDEGMSRVRQWLRGLPA